MTRKDDAVSTVIGAIVILAIMGTSLLYVNSVHVPRQGAALEVEGAERTEAALFLVASAVRSGSEGPTLYEIPLRPSAGPAPLLSGIVLAPMRIPGSMGFDVGSPRISVSAVLDAPQGGVPVNDPIREDLGGGKMRLYIIGNQTGGLEVGALSANVGGSYTRGSEYRIEGGLLLSNRTDGSTALGTTGIFVQRGTTTTVSWRIPLLAGGSQDIVGGSSAQVGLLPGPESTLGGGRAYNMSIRIDSQNIGAWSRGLQEALGPSAIVNSTSDGDPDNGTVTAIILPPSGTPAATRAVEMRLWAIRQEISLAQR